MKDHDFRINGAWRRRAAIAGILLLSAAVYADTLSHGFVWDDLFEIYRNPWILSSRFIKAIFFSNSLEWTGIHQSAQYAPLKSIVRILQYQLFGTSPWGYHLGNVLIHAASALMVFLISELLSERICHERTLLMPATAGLIFAVHPVLSEAVNWASAMAEMGMALFCLVALYSYMKAGDRAYGRLTASAAAFLAAVLFKVTALFCLPLFLVYDYSLRKAEGRPAFGDRIFWKNVFMKYIPLIVAVGAYLGLRSVALGGLAPKEGSTALKGAQAVVNVFPLFAKYLRLLLLPVDLNALYTFHPKDSLSDGTVALSLLVTVIFLCGLLAAARRNAGLLFCLMLILLPLIPCLYLPALGYSYYVFAERYLYLPAAGYAIAISVFAGSVLFRKPYGRTAPTLYAAVLLAVVAAFSYATVERNSVWSNSLTLWTDVVRKSPDSAVAHNNLGSQYQVRGNYAEALREYQIAVALDNAYVDAQTNLLRLRRAGFGQ